jgi:two-component system, OmpR family, sensor histidine kinase SenX3
VEAPDPRAFSRAYTDPVRHALFPSRASTAAGLAIAVLLAALAALQHHWLGEVSQAEKERTRARMLSSATRFARDLDREVTRAFLLLDPGGPGRRQRESFASRRARWNASALYPDLVRGVFVAGPSDGGRLALARVDDDAGRLVSAEWPQEWGDLRSKLEDGTFFGGTRPMPRRGRSVPAIDADVPALISPVFEPGPPSAGGAGERPGAPEGSYGIVWLDLDTIRRKLLPDLAAKHFAGVDGIEYRIEVVSVTDPRRVIYRAGPSPGNEGIGHADAEVELFGFLRTEEAGSAGHLLGPRPWDAPQTMAGGPGAAEERTPAPNGGPSRDSARRPWRLLVVHPAGSLEAAVASARHRNLAVSFGTLLLLALAMAMLLISTRRAQRLARQQLEFTAGVTHELATPLAGMRAAAQNLADGVVREPAQVREYGTLIEREGRRLTEMVEKVLAFAGLQSGRTAFARQPVAMERVIEEALAASARSLDEKGFRVETEIAPDLPEIEGDGPALRRALENLVGNAIKYGAEGAWLRVRARAGPGLGGSCLTVTVEDRGPGIADEDLAQLFEPFYRGRGRSAGAVAGSGLGLTVVRGIVEAHGGKVTVESSPGKGAAFTILLPVAEDRSGA